MVSIMLWLPYTQGKYHRYRLKRMGGPHNLSGKHEEEINVSLLALGLQTLGHLAHNQTLYLLCYSSSW
jgi:hypothetical protein